MKSKKPTYMQISDDIRIKILSESLCPNDKLPSQRQLATQYGVNVNTIQHAMRTLVEEKLLYSVRTSGYYVCGDLGYIKEQKLLHIKKLTSAFIADMQRLHLNHNELIEYMNNFE